MSDEKYHSVIKIPYHIPDFTYEDVINCQTDTALKNFMRERSERLAKGLRELQKLEDEIKRLENLASDDEEFLSSEDEREG